MPMPSQQSRTQPALFLSASLSLRRPPPPPTLPPSHNPLRTNPPTLLTPIRRPAEIRARPTEIAPGAAKPARTPGVDNRSAGIARPGGFGRGGWVGRFGAVGVAVAVAGLTACAAVEGLVLDLERKKEGKVVSDGRKGEGGGRGWCKGWGMDGLLTLFLGPQ